MKRWLYTVLCNFIYRHPRIYKLMCGVLFFGQDHQWREIAAAKIPAGKRAIELGCGMFPALKEGVVVDSSPKMIDHAMAGQAAKICASALDLPMIHDNSFDYALSVFPPGIAADNGFFQQKKFWQELHRILDKNGIYVAAIYIKYNNLLGKLSSGILDPLPKDFWEKLRSLAPEFEIAEEKESDNKGNIVVMAIAKKKS